jgi:hypothetical protein
MEVERRVVGSTAGECCEGAKMRLMKRCSGGLGARNGVVG